MERVRAAGEWTEADLAQLVDDRVRENAQLDYKEEALAAEKLAKFVAGFANTAGGTILLGVTDEPDADGKPTGVPGKLIGVKLKGSLDAEQLRYQQMIRSHCEPKVASVTIAFVGNYDKGPVVVIAVPPSFRKPHRVSTSQFYFREGGQTLEMSVDHLREMFVEGAAFFEKIEELREDVETVPNPTNPLLLIHLVPFSAFARPHQVDPRDVMKLSDLVPPIGHPLYPPQFALIGAVTVSKFTRLVVRRSGIMESLVARVGDQDQNGEFIYPWKRVENNVLEATARHLRLATCLNLSPPFAVSLTLVNVAKFRMLRKAFEHDDDPPRTLPLKVQPPAAVIEDFGADLKSVFRFAFDMIFQAAGRSGSESYSESGDWIRPATE